MQKDFTQGFDVIGLSAKVRNDDMDAIGALWQSFGAADMAKTLGLGPDDAVICVYHGYEGDHTAPYTMTIGYRMAPGATVPDGLTRVEIPAQPLAVFETNGAQPQTLIAQWGQIWQGDLDRAYAADFDTYDPHDPARVTVNVGLKG